MKTINKLIVLIITTTLIINCSNDDSATPTDPTPLEGNQYTKISSGDSHTLSIKADGTLWAWGRNDDRQYGIGDVAFTTGRPTQVGTDTNWSKVFSGARHSFGIKTNGTLWAWGNNTFAQLGNGNATRQLVPIQIGTANDWDTVSTGEGHTLALKTNGTLWAWGANTMGQLGDVTTIQRLNPVQIGTDTWTSISASDSFSVGIKTNGTLWSWGLNFNKQLGHSIASGSIHIPTQIGTATNWTQISTGRETGFAINSSGQMFTWGTGNLGLGATTSVNLPTLVSGSNYSKVCSQDNHTLIIKNDGSLWGFGINTKGELGDNTLISKTTPIQIGTETNWQNIETGTYFSIARKADGTVYGTGDNTISLLGISIIAIITTLTQI